MLMSATFKLLRMLPTKRENAVTIRHLAVKWEGKDPLSEKPSASVIRRLQAYMNELSGPADGYPALIERIEPEAEPEPELRVDGKKKIPKAFRYYILPGHVADWFMTEETAMNLLVTGQILGQSLGSAQQFDSVAVIDQAQARLGATSPARKRVLNKVRIVPDGIGRVPARINSLVLEAAISAIEGDKKLSFSYKSSKGRESTPLVSPQGLVAKDGTIYLVATKGLSDFPIHYPLQRISEAKVEDEQLQSQPGFNLDDYIRESAQLSHKLHDGPSRIRLELRVDPKTLYHFEERPLASGSDQVIDYANDSNEWSTVTAHIPNTVLLVPFLLSMLGYIEVVGPAEVRAEVKKQVDAMAARYSKDPTSNDPTTAS
jgi:predicted DNA-binding transcriptional regulator YafY